MNSFHNILQFCKSEWCVFGCGFTVCELKKSAGAPVAFFSTLRVSKNSKFIITTMSGSKRKEGTHTHTCVCVILRERERWPEIKIVCERGE